ncbi:hypothetical protein ACFYXF_13810 [Streptomyces sp. NPDC002680]
MSDAHERGRPGSDADDVESEEDCLPRAREMWAAGEPATRVDLETDPT